MVKGQLYYFKAKTVISTYKAPVYATWPALLNQPRRQLFQLNTTKRGKAFKLCITRMCLISILYTGHLFWHVSVEPAAVVDIGLSLIGYALEVSLKQCSKILPIGYNEIKLHKLTLSSICSNLLINITNLYNFSTVCKNANAASSPSATAIY